MPTSRDGTDMAPTIDITSDTIDHLDFTPSDLESIVTDEDSEFEKACELRRSVGFSSQPCGRVAVYKIGLVKPCQHHGTVYLCLQCWQNVELYPWMTWRCVNQIDGQPCNTAYNVREHVITIDKIR